MTTQDRMLMKLRGMGLNVPEGTVIHRTHAGAVMRREGAWSWSTWNPTYTVGVREVGSQFPMWALLACQEPWLTYEHKFSPEISVDPADSERPRISAMVKARKTKNGR